MSGMLLRFLCISVLEGLVLEVGSTSPRAPWSETTSATPRGSTLDLAVTPTSRPNLRAGSGLTPRHAPVFEPRAKAAAPACEAPCGDLANSTRATTTTMHTTTSASTLPFANVALQAASSYRRRRYCVCTSVHIDPCAFFYTSQDCLGRGGACYFFGNVCRSYSSTYDRCARIRSQDKNICNGVCYVKCYSFR